jgi:hypothetical protein
MILVAYLHIKQKEFETSATKRKTNLSMDNAARRTSGEGSHARPVGCVQRDYTHPHKRRTIRTNSGKLTSNKEKEQEK